MQKHVHVHVPSDGMEGKIKGIATDALQILWKQEPRLTRIKWWQWYTVDVIPGISTSLQTRLLRVRRYGCTIVTARHWIGAHTVEIKPGHGFRRPTDEPVWDTIRSAFKGNGFELLNND